MNKPQIILIKPQLAENIGMTARAMMNCGLDDLRLVTPKESHLSDKAISASSGADEILKNATVYNSTREAIADLEHVYATTARRRDMIKNIFTPEAFVKEISDNTGILFGPERTGLENDDIALADAIIEIPLNPKHTSLNLSQAVLIIGYEWYKSQTSQPDKQLVTNKTKVASKEQLLSFLDMLEKKMDSQGRKISPEKRPRMIRNLHNIFNRAELTEQEINTLLGMFNLTKD
ncbi:MAG: RNA methyltransferase [Lactobacillus sp.]|nr:RNA methyltransferase [Lactobacillus sp.]